MPSLNTRTVPLLDLRPQNGPLRAEIEAAIANVFQSQYFILGPDNKKFEEEMAAWLGVPHAIGCANGSDALLLALMAAGVGPGDEVAVPSFTFFATAGSVSRTGATPVFLDIDPLTFNLDPAALEQAARQHPRIKAVIPVHLFGGAADMDPILATAARQGWTVIEDGAQSIGAAYNHRPCFGLGHMATLSFFPSKNLGAFGDAGMVTTTDGAKAELLSALRVHGSREKYKHEWIGFNSRLDTLQAAILRVKLPHLNEWTAARQRNAARYQELLTPAGLPITVPAAAAWQTGHIWNQFVIRTPRRDELKAHLAAAGIGTEIYYPIALHRQPCYLDLQYAEGSLPESERACREVLALPIHSGLRDGDIEYVCDAIAGFFIK
ncbi:DegT/DnrJ/EryC1/StrS family aminotransferase [Paludibaculum fermentans]|uniref:DegT/DnrJ/EryC1/StrS family aminotransferase n=1 Tax=Paludibaculum fermentans TaxID=1473598 RepID=A0A7S7NYU7_PALFE|nr:DegT/DnrJ/EryC1/StrS family aminotransferase [Paludibaculum fermentans]QOY92315.1 DegT/DnrJ/EryC1/StrS family aminotransferase [Paludibaculum fermentans]